MIERGRGPLPVVTDEVRFELGGGRSMRAALSKPAESAGKRPAVLVIHEILGWNEPMVGVGRDFASHGYVALVPDLFDKPGSRALCVARTMAALARGQGEAFQDLERARTFLAGQPEVDASRIAVAGFCMGGGFAILLATEGTYRAAAPFYGLVPPKAERLAGSCPVVASYGGRDLGFAHHGERLAKHLAVLGVENDVRIYPDAGHSFFARAPKGFWTETVAPIGPLRAGYHEPSSEDAWERILAFFGRHLAAERPSERPSATPDGAGA